MITATSSANLIRLPPQQRLSPPTPLSEIAAVWVHPERVVGVHFFNPVHKIKLIGIIRGLMSSQDIDTALHLSFSHPMGPLELGT